MMEFFLSGGIMMWPMAAVALGILYLAGRTAGRVRRGDAAPDAAADEVQRGMQGILFWGVMSILLGALGTVSGIVVMTHAAAQAGGVVEPALIWGGISLALSSLVFGIVLFIVAAVLWFVLRLWQFRSARLADR
jgi:biopolymer transport protein ExbB/TolQ